MASRRSDRISQIQSHPVYNYDINCPDSGHEAGIEQVPATTQAVRKRRGRRGGGRGGAVGQASLGRGQSNTPPGSSNTSTVSNSNEVEEIRQVDNTTAMDVANLKAALGATCEEVTSYMQSVTSVLCTLFSVLTATQINDIEKSTNEMMKQDNLFNNCINQAKSAAAARDLSLKLAAARNASNEEKINSPLNETTVTPQSFAHNTNRGAVAAATPVTTQIVNTARPDWLKKLDENRKYNLILFGIHDINNKAEDRRIVDDVLWIIGCQHRIANITNIIRLGKKKPGKSRLLMVCFNSETAASQVLNRSTNLIRSASHGHIYIKRDLPREQRPPPRNSNSRVAEAARGASAVTMSRAVTPAGQPIAATRNTTDRSRSSSRPTTAPAPTNIVEHGNGLSDITSVSDFDGPDNDCSGYITVEETFGDDEGVTFTTYAEVHSARSPIAEGDGSPAAPTNMAIRSLEGTVINLEETIESANTEPGCDDDRANNVQKSSNVELRPGNE